MGRSWVHEQLPRWDDDKQRIAGGLVDAGHGEVVAGDWWRVEDEGRTLGYGWMDVSWGDAEILLAVDPEHRRAGVGTFILDQLDAEAARRGLRYLYNVVPADHPDPQGLTAWLQARGFLPAAEDGALLRRRVRA